MFSFSVKSAKTMAVFALGACLLYSATSHSLFEANPEELFKAARNYTVKIKTSVEIPFAGDHRGTFLGAGFVVDRKNGWIVTNAHVASRSRASVQVSSIDFPFTHAAPIYIDPVFDIAVLQVDAAKKLQEVNLDCAMTFSVGVPVGAFGHPGGADYTGTKGIVSTITSDTKTFGEFVQTDAPINPGNSGGPLINLRNGKIIGMNTARQENAQNMNYAIPSNQICQILTYLRQGEDPTPPRLGLAFFKDSDDKNTLRIAKIKSVNSFGFKEGDTIIKLKGDSDLLTNESQLLNKLRKHGSKISLIVNRENKNTELTGNFETLKPVLKRKLVQFSGVAVRDIDDPEFQEIINTKASLIVGHVASGSLGDNHNFSPNDIIESVDSKAIYDLDVFLDHLKTASKNKVPVKFRLKRPAFEQGSIFSYYEVQIEVHKPEVIEPGAAPNDPRELILNTVKN